MTPPPPAPTPATPPPRPKWWRPPFVARTARMGADHDVHFVRDGMRECRVTCNSEIEAQAVAQALNAVYGPPAPSGDRGRDGREAAALALVERMAVEREKLMARYEALYKSLARYADLPDEECDKDEEEAMDDEWVYIGSLLGLPGHNETAANTRTHYREAVRIAAAGKGDGRDAMQM